MTGATPSRLAMKMLCPLLLCSLHSPAQTQPGLQSPEAGPPLSGQASRAGSTPPASTLAPAAGTLRTSLIGNEQPLPQESAFSLTLLPDATGYRLSWAIADGYYLYRDKMAFRLDGQTITLAALPAGEITEDEFFGRVEIYRSGVGIDLPALEGLLEVTWQGCAEDRYCYPPAMKEFQLSE